MKFPLVARKDVFLAFLLFLCLPARPAHAYLDPGTGSYMFQLLIAGAVAGAFALKCTWGRLRTYLKSLFDGKKNPPRNE